MIYLIDRGFRINNVLNFLVNQCKYPGICNECFCLSCNVNDKYNVNDNDNDNVNDKNNVIDKANDNDNDKVNDSVKDNVNDKDNDLRSSFTNNDNDNDNDNENVNDNDNDKDNDKDNDNDNDNDNVNDNFIYLFDEKHQRGKPNIKEYPRTDSICGKPSGFTDLGNNISANINEDLQSWLTPREATLPENFRCIISGPSECGKTFLLKKLIVARIYFDKLYIIGPTDDQYKGVERINDKTDVEFVKIIKDLPSPDHLPKDLKKLMIFDDVRAKEPVINEYFCRG